ncbi:MAG: NB-ARC domain-containing protein, partial [Caldilineaceae bacterium]
QLCRTDAPWLIAVEGLGGIGKTSLANATVRRLIDQRAFDEVGWVTARTKRLNLGGHIVSGVEPALSAQDLIESLTYQLIPHYAQVQHTQSEPLLTLLHRKLKAVPHLIVIDNLETLVDVEALLPTLQELANPTKFLLTSREALFSTPNIYHFKVPELDSANALALVRQEIAVSNLTALASWRDDELLPIIDTVGGNPLALRLVIGQAHVHDVDAILEQLRLAKGEPAENLYTYIYRHAWQSLTELEQKVLLLMPVVNPDGDELSFIADVSDFPIEQIRKTLNRLVTLSLVDVLESEHQYRYRIHGLTRTFLHDEILKW